MEDAPGVDPVGVTDLVGIVDLVGVGLADPVGARDPGLRRDPSANILGTSSPLMSDRGLLGSPEDVGLLT